jgi:hypothetical protein
MTTNRRTTLLTVAFILVAFSAGASAQESVSPQPGEHVRIHIVELDHPRFGQRCEGWIAAVERDTIVIGQPRSCAVGSYAGRLRVARGDRGSRLSHTGIGLLGGALAGGVIARIAVGDGCRIDSCDDGEFAVGVITLLGTVSGALVGTVIGATLPAGPRWVTETVTRSLRVANAEVHPGLRVSSGVARR